MVFQTRCLWLLAAVFTVACETVAEHHAEGAGGLPISNQSRFYAPEGFYAEALPINTDIFIRTFSFDPSTSLGICGETLVDAAGTKPTDRNQFSEPYDAIATNLLTQDGVPLDAESEVRLAFQILVSDVPDQPGNNRSISYCFVDFKVNLTNSGTLKLARGESFEFPVNRFNIYEAERLYFVEAQSLKSSIEREIRSQIALLAPTLSGAIEDSCGYFMRDPESSCATHYRLLLRAYQRRQRCAASPDEKAQLQKKIDAVVEKLSSLPEPEVSKRFVIERSSKDSESNACS